MRYRLSKDIQRPYINVSDGKVDGASEEFLKLTGYSEDEILGNTVEELCKLLRLEPGRFLKCASGVEKKTAYIFTKDMEPREVEIRRKCEEGGNRYRYVLREKPGSRLYENLKLFRQPLEQNKMRTALLSYPDLIILDANSNYLKFWDSPNTRKEVTVGKKYTDIISEDFKDKVFEKVMEEVGEGRPFFRYEAEYRHPGKKPTYWDLSYMPIYHNDEIRYIVLQCVDVTEKVIEKENIRQQKVELEAIISSLSDELIFYNKKAKKLASAADEDADIFRRFIDQSAIHVMRVSYPDLVIKKMNDSYYNLIKKIRPSIEKKEIMEGRVLLKFISEDETVVFLNDMVKLLQSDRKLLMKVMKFHLDGETHYMKRFFQAISDKDGQIKEIVIMAFEVTEEVMQKQEAESNLLKQEEFYANISHELKTPLNVIFSSNQLFEYYLKNGLLEDNAERMLGSTKTIRDNCYRLTRLISNLTDLSKIRAGYLKLNLTQENIVSLVEDTVDSVADFVKYKGLKMTFDTDTEEKFISCDPERIDRIVLNLISNSVKFSREGGHILVKVADKGDKVEISVRDNGIGIDEENLDSIFDRFYQGDNGSLRCNKGGSGIGLHLAKSIVELHGGRITVESRLGEGSEFRIELPVKL